MDQYVVEFALLFGIKPWELLDLTLRHYLAFVASINAHRESRRG